MKQSAGISVYFTKVDETDLREGHQEGRIAGGGRSTATKTAHLRRSRFLLDRLRLDLFFKSAPVREASTVVTINKGFGDWANSWAIRSWPPPSSTGYCITHISTSEVWRARLKESACGVFS